MTDHEFIINNRLFRQRQAAIKQDRKRTEPSRISDLIPDVLADLEQKAASDCRGCR